MSARVKILFTTLALGTTCVTAPVAGAVANGAADSTAVAQRAGIVELAVKAPVKRHLKLRQWIKIRVKVTNRDTIAARNVKLRATGPGVKFAKRPLAYGALAPGQSKVRVLRVRVLTKPERLISYGLSATNADVYTYESTRLLPTYKRKLAVPGRYAGKGSGWPVNFRIDKQRRVVGWRTTMRVTCGGWPDPIRYEVGHYNFPKKVKIPRGGRVDAKFKGKNYSVNLRATFDGRVVRDGYFSYSGPDRCRGTVLWTAQRKGK